ncbi:MAG TPA: DUF488 family protein [Methylomirabilota bacterium]|nr:DUF488 family protein [Methylomirabilota bacterium]
MAPRGRVGTKRVYEPAAPSDGARVLVMRLWPRGIRRAQVDLWLRDLGAEIGTLRRWNAGRLSWPELRRRYLAGLRRPPASEALATLRALARRRRVTLLCSCADPARCHRTVLAAVLGRTRPSSRA